ncbi:MAG TPA: TIGR02266 family protein, partial [Myxococcaceae bacterium]|nr:TIGR02266 family protein [Myxococcaceae bacterium]
MTDGSQRAIGLVVKLPFATREEFLAKYGANLSRGGIFLRSKTVKPPGTAVTLDLRLASGERLIHASARVEFVTGRNGAGASGMGLRFLVVDPTTQQFLDRALATLPHAQSLQPPIPHGAADVEFGPGGPSSTAEAPLVKTFPTRAGTSASAGNGASHGALERPLSPAALLQARPSQPSALSAPPFEQPQEEPQRVGPTIGVDLGTTSCRASYVRGGRPLLLASPDGYTGAPSLVALDSSSKLVVGRAAKGHLLTHPRLTVSRAKRLIGRQFHSPVVQSATARSPHEIAPGESGEAAVKLADRVYPLEQITA